MGKVKRERRRLAAVDKKYGLPKGSTALMKEIWYNIRHQFKTNTEVKND